MDVDISALRVLYIDRCIIVYNVKRDFKPGRCF